MYIYIKPPHSSHLYNNGHRAWSPKLAAISGSTVLNDHFYRRFLTNYYIVFVTFCIFSLLHEVIYLLACLLACMLTWLFACFFFFACLLACLFVCLFDCLPAYLLTYCQGTSIQVKIQIWYH